MKTKIYLILVSIFIAFLIYEAFNYKPTKYDPKAKRLACQSDVISFEKIYKDNYLLEAVKALNSGNFQISSKIEYSKIMKSKLINIMDTKKLDEIVKNSIKRVAKQEQNVGDNPLVVDYYIYENDKEDTNKKNEDAKLYAGFIVFEFKYNTKLVYKMQIDYMKDDASDLEKRVDCVIKSFMLSLN